MSKDFGFFKTCWLAARPFSLPASAVPVVLGTVAAVATGSAQFNLLYFVLALIAMLLLHAAANLLNDVYDFRLGLDTHVFPGSGAVVRKLLSPEAASKGALLLFMLGSLIGLYLAFKTSWHILWIGALGLLIGTAYSYSRIGLKYKALGDLSVFLGFGILGTLGAWTIQSRTLSLIPVLWAIPIGLHIVGILHANNWRDIQGDMNLSSTSVAALLADRGSFIYYTFLLFTPYLFIAMFIFTPAVFGLSVSLPLGCLATFLSFPLAVKLFLKALRRAAPLNPSDFIGLDAATGQLNLIFGLLMILGFIQVLFI